MPLEQVGPPPQLGVLGGILAEALGGAGVMLYRGYEARQWPKIDGKVMGWKIGGNLMNPVAEMTYMYEVFNAHLPPILTQLQETPLPRLLTPPFFFSLFRSTESNLWHKRRCPLCISTKKKSPLR